MSNRDRLPVKIAGRGYVLDPQLYQQQKNAEWKDKINPLSSHDVSRTPRILKKAWTDWSLGAGQRLADSDGSNPRRYWGSIGFDPFRVPGKLLAIPTLTFSETFGAATGSRTQFYATTEAEPQYQRLYLFDTMTGKLYVKTDPEDTFTLFQDFDAVAGYDFANKMTSLGDDLYVAMGDSVQRRLNIAGTLSTFSTVDTHMITSVDGRLIGAFDEELFELDGAGAKTTIFTHETNNFQWYGAVPGPRGMYAWGTSFVGTDRVSAVYYFEILDYDGSFSPARRVLPLQKDEHVFKMLAYGGYYFLATNLGVRMAEVLEDGDLKYGPVIGFEADFDDYELRKESKVYGIFAYGDAIYFTCDSYTLTQGDYADGRFHGIGKISLNELVNNLQPPYCSYAMKARSETPQSIIDVIIYKERLLLIQFVYSNPTNNDLAGVSTVYVQEPWSTVDSMMPQRGIHLGETDMGTVDLKSFYKIRLVADRPVGEYYSRWKIPNANTMPYVPGVFQDPYVDANSEAAFIDFNLLPIATLPDPDVDYKKIKNYSINPEIYTVDNGPQFINAIEVQAFIEMPKSDVFLLPIVMDELVRSEDRVINFDIDAELAFLQGLMETGEVTTIEVAGQSYIGFIFNIAYETSELRSVNCDAITGPVIVYFQRLP